MLKRRMLASWATMRPPLEYQNPFPGVEFTITRRDSATGSPFRISTTVGSCNRHHQLADRARRKQRLRGNRRSLRGIGPSVRLRPVNLEIPDHRDADSRDVIVLHPVQQAPALKPVYWHVRHQVILNLYDSVPYIVFLGEQTAGMKQERHVTITRNRGKGCINLNGIGKGTF